MSDSANWIPDVIIAGYSILLTALGVTVKKNVTLLETEVMTLRKEAVYKDTCDKCSLNMGNEVLAVKQMVTELRTDMRDITRKLDTVLSKL
jgi:hypothetical protein